MCVCVSYESVGVFVCVRGGVMCVCEHTVIYGVKERERQRHRDC